jgi:hypothetical protein
VLGVGFGGGDLNKLSCAANFGDFTRSFSRASHLGDVGLGDGDVKLSSRSAGQGSWAAEVPRSFSVGGA